MLIKIGSLTYNSLRHTMQIESLIQKYLSYEWMLYCTKMCISWKSMYHHKIIVFPLYLDKPSIKSMDMSSQYFFGIKSGCSSPRLLIVSPLFLWNISHSSTNFFMSFWFLSKKRLLHLLVFLRNLEWPATSDACNSYNINSFTSNDFI